MTTAFERMDESTRSRCRNAWTDADVTKTDIIKRFRLTPRDMEALTIALGPKAILSRLSTRAISAGKKADRANVCRSTG